MTSYELFVPPAYTAAYSAGDVTLMATKAGLSTTLVDSSHSIVGYAGLVETAGEGAVALVLPTSGGTWNFASSPTLRSWAGVAASIAVLGATAGTWYVIHRLTKGKTSGGVRWRLWLMTRVTPSGAEEQGQARLETCPRCGDNQGLAHECRDLAR